MVSTQSLGRRFFGDDMNKTDYERLSSAMQLNHRLNVEQHERAERLQAENE